MWKIIVANKSDNDFLIELPSEPFTEVINHFNKIIKAFSDLDSSVFCTSAIFLVGSYNVTNEKLSIHYHVDTDEEAIRITTIDLE
jgi:hypothetical protein